MDFTHYDLGRLRSGTIVEVVLAGNAANVQLMDSANFHNYKSGRRYRFIGGTAKHSPVTLQVPHSGHWHVAIDLRGSRGTVRSSLRSLPEALPPIRETPLSSLVQRREPSPDLQPAKLRPEYDVFISHASEDKDEIVRPLASALQQAGLRVWYDEFELRIGDNLRAKIDLGLANSRFGVVVLSSVFFAKGWTKYELDGLVTRDVDGGQDLLPIWHKITKDEVVAFSPSLANRLARSTSTHTIGEIAAEIVSVIREGR